MTQIRTAHYEHLGPFSGLVAAAAKLRPLFPMPASAAAARDKARQVLRFTIGDERPSDPRPEGAWESDGVRGEEISWDVGFGPRTQAWVLRPAGSGSRLPGILALHDHGHYKFFGKEKIADGPQGPLASVAAFRDTYYGGRAYANELARQGYVVLVHDAFLWGSRKFPLEAMPAAERALAASVGPILAQASAGEEIVGYNGAAYLHEHLVSKYCTLLGTSFAAIVAYEDRVALNYLRSRADVDPQRTACVGLSGGGARAALLCATCDGLAASVVAGMMSTYEGLLDHDVAPHTWMFFPPGLAAQGDWPDLAASAAPAPLLVQYLLDDAQFTVEGMRGADARIAALYAEAGAAAAYAGEFYPGPHRFDIAMQIAAFAWLERQLGSAAGGLRP